MARSGVRAALLLAAGLGTLMFGAGQVSAQSGEQTGEASNSNSQSVTIVSSGSATVSNNSNSQVSTGDEAVTLSADTSAEHGSGDAAQANPSEENEQTATVESIAVEQSTPSYSAPVGSPPETNVRPAPVSGQKVGLKYVSAYTATSAPRNDQAQSATSEQRPDAPAAPGDGLDRYTAWLNQSLLPGSAHPATHGGRSLPGGVAAFLVILSLTSLTAAFSGYLSQLRRSGFVHGARSDAEGVSNFLNPTKVGLVWACSSVQSPPFYGGLTLTRRGGECI